MNPGANNLAPIEIPNFRLIEPIGQGGMGVVWLGQQERPNRKVAVKKG